MPLGDRLRTAYTALTAPRIVRTGGSVPAFPPATKASATGPAIAGAVGPGDRVWSDRRVDRLAEEAYQVNAIAHACIARISRSVAGLPIIARRRGREVPLGGELDTLLRRPNPRQVRARFLEATVSNLLIAGNAYLEKVTTRDEQVRELHTLRPDRMTVKPGQYGIPRGFVYDANGREITFASDPATGRGPILHLREYHPLDDWYGFARTEAAARAIDQSNLAAEHNAALMARGMRPVGALSYKHPLTEEQETRARLQLHRQFGGVSNVGEPMVLGGEWTFLDMAGKLRDMDFFNGIQQKAREICASYGVPHILVVPGEATYSNREQAYLELFEVTVLPLASVLLEEIALWLDEHFGPRLELTIDMDKVTALEPRRTAFRKQVREEWESGLIRLDEARDQLQYDPVGGEEGERFKSGGMPAIAPPGEEPPALAPPETPPPAEGEAAKSGIVPFERKAVDDLADGLDDDAMSSQLLPIIRETLRRMAGDIYDRVGLTISFDLLDPRVIEFLRQWAAERVTGLIGETTRQALRETITAGVEAGEGTFDLMRRIRAAFGEASAARARVIAETEVTLASGWARQRAMEEAELDFKQWLCVSGDTRVAAVGITHVARRRYSGPLVTLGSASGGIVTVTAEHPVLTGRGWIRADLVEEGDYLVSYERKVEGVPPGAGVVPDVDHVPPTIAEVFDALLDRATDAGAVPGIEHFHRHGTYGEVEVVAAGRDLLRHVEPSCSESIREFLLVLPDELLAGLMRDCAVPQRSVADRDADTERAQPSALSLDPGALLRLGGADDASVALVPNLDAGSHQGSDDCLRGAPVASSQDPGAVPAQVVGDDAGLKGENVGSGVPAVAVLGDHEPVDLGDPLNLSRLGEADGGGLAVVPSRHAMAVEQVPDSPRRALEFSAEHDRGITETVLLKYDRCISVEVRTGTCHVYDYSTKPGWMIANSLVIHNSTDDSHTRDSHRRMDGQIVPVKEKFRSPSGDRGEAPGMFSTAGENIYCRCASIPMIPGIDGPEPEAGDLYRLKAARPHEHKARDLEQERARMEALRGDLDRQAEDAVRQGFAEQERRMVALFLARQGDIFERDRRVA